ncbi:EamA family transporter [Chitinophaga defluvii]|uniref:DMT family transporter n=1 Tax=Chitinophaga defluvii TaxID=3163343 RepID=A0ABV2SZU6_9BACT
MNKYILMVFTGACSFGILSTFVKLAYREGYTPAEISFSQAFIGMGILWLLVFIQERRRSGMAADQIIAIPWWPLLLTGAAIGWTTYVYYVAVHYIPASVAIVILMQFTWISMLLEWCFFNKKPVASQLVVTVVILSGTLMAGGWLNTRAGNLSTTGILYALGAALLYAVYIVANSRLSSQVSPLKKSAVMMMGSSIGIFVVNASSLATSTHTDVSLIKWAVFLAIFGTVIPPVLFARGIPKAGVGVSAILMTAELPVAVICSHFVLSEEVGVVQWLGIVVMLLAIVLLNVQKMKYLKRG